MAVDPELKALLNALVEGQIKLVEETNRQFRLVHERMDGEFKLVHERMDRFDGRMREYTEAVVRGLTNGAKRDGDLEARLDDLDRRVIALERERRG